MTDGTLSSIEMQAGQIALLAISAERLDGSGTTALLNIAIDAALAVAVDVSILDLRDLDLSIHEPFSHGNTVPQGALVIRQILCSHDGLLICVPGYTGSISALVETALAWGSLPTFGTNGPTPLRDKIAAIMYVSDDRSDGATALSHPRRMLDEKGVAILPDALAFASDAFAHGTPRDSSIATLASIRSDPG